MKTIYISGKITGDDNYIIKFVSYEARIRKDFGRVKIINPIYVKPFLGIKRWLFYMIPAFFNVLKSDKVLLLPDWKQSKGACIERFFGKVFMKEVYLINDKPRWHGKVFENQNRYILLTKKTIPSRHFEIVKIINKYQKL